MTTTPESLATGLAALDAASLDRIAAELLAAAGTPSRSPLPAGSDVATAHVGSEVGPVVGATEAAARSFGAEVPSSVSRAVRLSTEPPVSLPRPGGSSVDLAGIGGALPPLFEGEPFRRRFPASPRGDGLDRYFLDPSTGAGRVAAPAFRRRFDVRDVRRDFPILAERVHGRPLVWLDNAATTQKPRSVIDRIVHYYEHESSNVHRGAHLLAARSTDAFEAAREKVRRFLGAGSVSEIVFVRGTTEAINLVANAWGLHNLVEGDEIVLTTIEHHSNIVPWQFLARRTGAVLRVVPVTDRGEVLLADFERCLGPRTRLVAVSHVSNALGTVLPVAEMTRAAHRHGALVVVDGAQAVSHFPVDVREIGADFYALSGHKLFAPTGVGVLYGRREVLERMGPWQGGGNMIEEVTFEESTFAPPPARFEAGTGTLAPAVGLGAAIDYLDALGMENVARHEHELLVHATEALGRVRGIRLIGTAPEKAGVISFTLDSRSVEEIGACLDREGIAVRAGHHCAQPTMARYGVKSTVRPSFALYNTHEEVEHLARTVHRLAGRA